jgi:hypothetical protein
VRWPPASKLVNWNECSVVGYSPDSNGVSTVAEESPLLRAVTKQRLGKTRKDWGLTCAVVIRKVCTSAIAL